MSGVAVVTGAARGIGLATTRRFVDQGMRVAMVDRDGDVLEEAAEEFGDAVAALIYDVSIPDQVDAMVADVKAGSSESGRSARTINPTWCFFCIRHQTSGSGKVL